jgi:predicted dehydrogenase
VRAIPSDLVGSRGGPVTARYCRILQPAKAIGDLMAQQKPLNIGMIGYGFMGRTHSNAYKRVNDFFDVEYRPALRAVCGRSAPGANSFAEKWGYESVETDWRKLVERKDIDAIDICTPNNTHAEIAIAAAEAGKMVLCEKPLAMNLVEGQKMVDAVEKAGVPNTIGTTIAACPP